MFRLRFFGGALLEGTAGPLTGRAVQRRRLALLALLAAAPKQTLSRDKLIAALWPDADNEHARHLLSDSLYILNKALGKDALRVLGDDVGLNTSVVWCDVVAFRELLDAGRAESAAALYFGPFLDGFFLADAPEFERWVEMERDRLARAYARALEDLAEAATAEGRVRDAVGWWRQRATLQPLDTRVAMALVRALAAAGDRAGALQHARVHETMLREELALEPPIELEHLVAELRREPARAPAARAQAEAVTVQASIADEEPVLAPIRQRRVRVGRRRAVAVAALLLLVLAGSMFWRRHAANASLPTRAVVLADINGSEPTLSLTVREALRAELESTRGVRLLSDDAARETMRLMRLPVDAALGSRIALDVARRRGAPLVIGGSVTRAGQGVQIIAQLIEAPGGGTVATFTERPASNDDVLAAVTRLARSIRSRVLSVPIDTMPSFPAVSTASFEALQYYVRAREAAARAEPAAAAELAEAALVHDSLFALAHYFAADQLWYIDQQRHSNEHMLRAYQLSRSLPPREQLIVKARYQQLLRDEPDSAIVYWKLLARSYPDDPIAYEGLRWAYRALAEVQPMAVAAESAYVRDPAKPQRYVGDMIHIRLRDGDSAAAFRLARKHGLQRWAHEQWALLHEQWAEALPLAGNGLPHFLLLALGRIDDARAELERVRARDRAQDLPRALLLQARVELEIPGNRQRARALVKEALAWLESADLSPPTYARYAERIAETAARLDDEAIVLRVQRLIRELDGGRNLRSYRMALTTIAAARAFVRGDMAAAAGLAGQSWPGMFYGRSVATTVLLEADARGAAGERAAADSLYRVLLAGRFNDGDTETGAILRQIARKSLEEAAR